MLSRFECFMYTQQKIEHMYCEICILRSAIIHPKGSKQQYSICFGAQIPTKNLLYWYLDPLGIVNTPITQTSHWPPAHRTDASAANAPEARRLGRTDLLGFRKHQPRTYDNDLLDPSTQV